MNKLKPHAKYYERDRRPTKPSICYLALYRKSWLTSGLKIQLSFVSQYADGREGNLLVAKLTLGRPCLKVTSTSSGRSPPPRILLIV